MKRKEFIRLTTSTALLLLANGRVVKAIRQFTEEDLASRSLFRFAVASDGHYGEKGTEYEQYFSTLVSSINIDHRQRPFKFVVVNGDIVHNDKVHYPAAKQALDQFECKYYVSQGNHDRVTADEWQSVWNMPVNFDFTHRKKAFLVGTTSNEKGEYLCPDIPWFSEKLEAHKNKDVFIFVHINPGALTKNAVDCPEFFQLLEKYPNIKAVFNGHDHDQEDIKFKSNIPFVFDAHFGGSWGTAYRGYRVVEVMKDGSALTYIMNPLEKINNTKLTKQV
jgi:hypothetical protein